MKKILYGLLTLLVLMGIASLLIFMIVKVIGIYEDNGILPSYTCEDGREKKVIIQGGDSVYMCNQGELYKERIKYYKQKLD